MSANPYSPPKAALEAHAAGGYWRDGKLVVLAPGGVLPERCVKCNEAAALPMKRRKLYWHHPAVFLLIFINVVIYAIVALLVRRKAEVTYGVCAKHVRKRRIFIAVGWIGLLLGIFLIAADPLAGILGIIAALIAGFIGSRLAYPRRITKEEVRLAGCGEAFLASLEQPAQPAQPAQPVLAARPPARAGLGRCPKCRTRVPMDAPACLTCKTVYTPGQLMPVP